MLLQAQTDIEIIGEAESGQEALELCHKAKPDVAIMDISMPKLDGIEATREIKRRCPSVMVLILSAYDDDQFVFALLEAGAAGYLLKSVRSREVIDAVRAVYSGESVLHPAVAKKVLNRFMAGNKKAAAARSSETLSDREKEILKLAARGLSNADIAGELCLSIRTVQGHLARAA